METTIFRVRDYGGITEAFLAAKALYDAEIDRGNENIELAPYRGGRPYTTGYIVTQPQPFIDLAELGIHI